MKRAIRLGGALLLMAALVACSGPAAVAPAVVDDAMLAPVPHPGAHPEIAVAPVAWGGHDTEPDWSGLGGGPSSPPGGGGSPAGPGTQPEEPPSPEPPGDPEPPPTGDPEPPVDPPVDPPAVDPPAVDPPEVPETGNSLIGTCSGGETTMAANRLVSRTVLHPPFRDGTYAQVVEPGSYQLPHT